MSQDLYQEIILEECKHPKNFGSLSDADLTLEEHNASCGDKVTVFMKLKKADGKNQVIDLKWNGEGCAISMSAMSVLSSKILKEKMTIEQLQQLQQTDMEALLGLEEITIGREKCLLIGLHAVQHATTAKKIK
jgi:NifU-like protein involved in Fe-S cluster formation